MNGAVFSTTDGDEVMHAEKQPRTLRGYVCPLTFLGWIALFVVLFAVRPLVADSLGGEVEQTCVGARGGGHQCFDARWTFVDAVESTHPALTWFLGVPSLTLGFVFVAGVVCWIVVAAMTRRR